ncbi:MAG: pilus assembly protein N-terminal domain-containing protein, partial [Planctomycetaceae bacterium]|nr:pilus assembly protein N-terminal domain-containing protein [Planctomycetaceae bacterium]
MPLPRFTVRLLFAAAFLLLVITSGSTHAQDRTRGIPATSLYQLRTGNNELAVFQRFTTFIEHSARIKQVLDFDEEVIQIDPVDQNPFRIQVLALKTGVTTVTIIDEAGQRFAVEVLVKGDVRHLESTIRRLYPNDTVYIEEIKGAVRLDGWVSKPEHVSEIQQIAEQFYPSVMNHMKIGGVQQVLLKCDVLEVQRNKFRKFGMNFSLLKPDSYAVVNPGPIVPISTLTATPGANAVQFGGFADSSISFGFTRPNQVFQGFISALREEGLLRFHASPILVTHNGRPARLHNGGETPILVPSGLGTVGIDF